MAHDPSVILHEDGTLEIITPDGTSEILDAKTVEILMECGLIHESMIKKLFEQSSMSSEKFSEMCHAARLREAINLGILGSYIDEDGVEMVYIRN